MLEWVEGLAGPDFATAVLWTLAALILLVIVLVVVRLIRSMTFGTFVAGGRNRKTRLAVMDAAAVDSHRRLVLVRRDDVEHLILIGGPSDVVVERDIRLGQPRRAAMTGDTRIEAPAPQRSKPPEPAAAPRRPAPPTPTSRPQPTAAYPQRAARETPPQPASRAMPVRMPPASVGPSQALQTTAISATIRQPAAASMQQNSLDDTLLKELEVTFDAGPPQRKATAKPPELTLDDEMTKLLGELSSHKR